MTNNIAAQLRSRRGEHIRPGERLCSVCELWKPEDAFWRDGQAKGGRKARCRECERRSRGAAQQTLAPGDAARMRADRLELPVGRCAGCGVRMVTWWQFERMVNGRANVQRFNVPQNDDRLHNAAKPLDLLNVFIDASSDAGDIVLDPFLGSGTTLIACEKLGRRCRAVEIDPGYTAVALQRFFDMTGVEPVLLEAS